MMSLNKRLDLIEPKILDSSFRAGRGTANEVNFWIFDYDPEDEMAVRAHVDFLVNRINGKHDDIRIACFDLYSLMLDFFEGKIADSRIMADMQVAADTSADVILFNIDAEADSDSKTNKDPIVKVFMNVFNKMQGFCGSMPWIAECRIYDHVVSHIAHQQIELDLDDGVKVNYEKFQSVEVPIDGGKSAVMDLLAKI